MCDVTVWVVYQSVGYKMVFVLSSFLSLLIDFCPFRPFWLMILLAVLIQHITGRFCFIKKTAGTRDLDNR